MVPAAIFVICVLFSYAGAYETFSGTKPEIQERQKVNDLTKPISGFMICREAGGRYEQIADILADTLSGLGYTLTIGDLSNLDACENKIVLGDLSNPDIADLAYDYRRNTIDLGEEGYNLITRPRFNPPCTNGSWIILILGAVPESEGVLRGAYTLVDLIDAGGSIGNYRIRDYPDQEFRGLMHWLPPVGYNLEDTIPPNDPLSKSQWVEQRKEGFKAIAPTGCNSLGLGGANWALMGTVYNSIDVGPCMCETAYWARYFGMEPVPEIGPFPANIPQTADMREGVYIKDERFKIDSDGGLVDDPFEPQFDNDAHEMDFSGWDQGEWSDLWTHPEGLSYDPSNHCISFSGTPNTGQYFHPTPEWDRSLFSPRSFYVLECVFSGAEGLNDDNAPSIGVYVRDSSTQNWTRIFHEKITTGTGTFKREYFFWTPPKDQNKPAGYPCGWDGDKYLPCWYQFDMFKIQIYHLEGQQACNLNIHSLFLERRDSRLRNVMYDPANGLEFNVTDITGSILFTEGIDYDLDFVPLSELDYRMPTHPEGDPDGNIAYLYWNNEEYYGNDILVSYTAGVPRDWSSGGQRTTWCWSNDLLYDHLKDTIRKLYIEYDVDIPGGPATYAVNPKRINIRMDEVRGVNRCGRCVGEDKTNAEYFAAYVDRYQQILDELVLEGDTLAKYTTLAVSGNMINPYHNGQYSYYQYQSGGPWGQSAMINEELGILDREHAHICIGMGRKYAYDARDNNWPELALGPGQSNVTVNVAMSPPGYEYNSPEYYAQNPKFYEYPVTGFGSQKYSYYIGGSWEFFTEDQERLLDYAWKRHRHPHAALHAYQSGFYVAGNVSGQAVEIDRGVTLNFRPFGHREYRHSWLGDESLTSAVINWGEGTPVSVINNLNKNNINHTFNNPGSYNVTLTNVATLPMPPGGESSYSVVIPVNVVLPPGGGDKEEPGLGLTKQDIPDRYALFQNSPNPFNPVTLIRFDLPENAAVKLAIYNVKGERVRLLVDGFLQAGRKAARWDGKDDLGRTTASGVYFYRIETEAFVESKKMVLLK